MYLSIHSKEDAIGIFKTLKSPDCIGAQCCICTDRPQHEIREHRGKVPGPMLGLAIRVRSASCALRGHRRRLARDGTRLTAIMISHTGTAKSSQPVSEPGRRTRTSLSDSKRSMPVPRTPPATKRAVANRTDVGPAPSRPRLPPDSAPWAPLSRPGLQVAGPPGHGDPASPSTEPGSRTRTVRQPDRPRAHYRPVAAAA